MIPASSAKSKTPDDPSFPVVGIGTSAGGLETLALFLGQLTPDAGMAYVIVQHLDPHHKGMLPELLQRMTAMPVAQVRDRMKVKPNHIYVIPPNKDLSILHGALHLLDREIKLGLQLPIDYFFRSLAADCKENAVGVILSGMGSDGMLGLRAIKECSGLTLVQEPDSAKFKSMPQSAVDAGVADIVAIVEELPERITDYFKNKRHGMPEGAKPVGEAKSQSALEKVVILLRERTGNDFALYKKNTLYRRIERRMALHQIDTMPIYVRYLRENPEEVDLLFNELLIGVTSFFRDSSVWEYLSSTVWPEMLAEHPSGKAFRAWIPACSTGEEAYSLAIIFKEALARCEQPERYSLQIFATDIDSHAVELARIGHYPDNIAADVSPERLARYFVEAGKGFEIAQEIRDMVVFATQNITMDPPFTRLDFLSCRNLLIYFGADLQKKLIPLFHFALNPRGILMLGSAESIGNHQTLFTPLESRTRIYRRLNERPSKVDFPMKSHPMYPKFDESKLAPAASNEQLVLDQLRQHHTPAAVLIKSDGDILYISGRTGKYLEPAIGKASMNIHAMAREGLRHVLPGAIRQALTQHIAVRLNGLQVESGGSMQTVNVTVQPVEQPGASGDKAMIVFADVPSAPAVGEGGQDDAGTGRPPKEAGGLDADALAVELQHTRSELQDMCEEAQTVQEELKSANEELQSTNEELQSTNEELTTSKEEMQALNEELQSVNAELEAKMKNMSAVIGDMQNLINSTEIATIFLDTELQIRRFTPFATRLFKLLPLDAGRPLSDIVTELDYPQLLDDATEVLRTLVFSDKTVATRDGRWFRVRIMPYRSPENIINGVVITFVDISETKVVSLVLQDVQRVLDEQFATNTVKKNDAVELEKILDTAQLILKRIDLTDHPGSPIKANVPPVGRPGAMAKPGNEAEATSPTDESSVP